MIILKELPALADFGASPALLPGNDQAYHFLTATKRGTRPVCRGLAGPGPDLRTGNPTPRGDAQLGAGRQPKLLGSVNRSASCLRD